MRDIVGLYLDPPARTLVLCVDEKLQIQALDRTAPLLPMHPGQAGRRHRSVELRNFLDTIEENLPPDLDVHLILDNYGTHKT